MENDYQMEDTLKERRRTGLHVKLTNLLCYLCHQKFDSEDEFRNHSHHNDGNDTIATTSQFGSFDSFHKSENPVTTATTTSATMNDEFLQVKLEVESEPELDFEPDFDPLATNDEQNENISAQESNDDDDDYNIQNSRASSNRKRRRGRPRKFNNSQRTSAKQNRGSTKLLDLNISKRRRRDDTKENENVQQEFDNYVSNIPSESQIVVPQPQRKPLRCLENLDEIQVNCEVCAIKYTSLKLFMQHLYTEVAPTVNVTNNKNRRDEVAAKISTTTTTTSSSTKGSFCFECKASFSTIQLYNIHMKKYHSQEQQQQQNNSRLSSSPHTDMMENMEEHDVEDENEEDKIISDEDNTKKSSYQKAKRTHKCELCAKVGVFKAFKYSCHLRRHILAHSSEAVIGRPRMKYECPACGHNFKGKLDLNRHLGNDLDTVKPCTYDSCNETFVYKCLLRNHLREHRGVEEKPYKCKFKNCQRSFSTQEQLNHHIAVKQHCWELHRPPSAKSKTTTTTTVGNSRTFKSTIVTTPSRIAKKSTASALKVIKSESLEIKSSNPSENPRVQNNTTTKSLKIENENPNSSTSQINENDMVEMYKESAPILDFENCLLMNDHDNILDTEIFTPGSPSSLICNSPLSVSQTNDDDEDDDGVDDNNSNEHDEHRKEDLVDQKAIVESTSEKSHEEKEETEKDSKSKSRSRRKLQTDDVKRSSTVNDNNSNDDENHDDDDGGDDSSSSGFEQRHKCKTCSKAFKFQCQLRRHSFTHLNHKPTRDMRCPGCARIFLTRENHRQHIHTNQLLVGESRLKCPFEDSCPDLTYNYRCALKQHVQTHIARGQKPKPHACKECPRRFRSAYDLKKHEKVHDKQRKGYKRKYRPTKYSESDDNENNSDENDNPSTPDFSTKEKDTDKTSHSRKSSGTVSDNDIFDPPLKIKKKKTKEEKLAEKCSKYARMKRRHKCEKCAEEGIVKAFKFRCHLRRHLFTHQNEVRYPGNDNRKPPVKKYECPGCHRMFAFNREFNHHKAANTVLLQDETLPLVAAEERQETKEEGGDGQESTKKEPKANFKCTIEVCGAEFEWRCSYRNHMREHKEQGLKPKPFPCTFEGCKRNFASNYDRNQHAKRHTNQKSYLCNHCGKALSSAATLELHVLNHEGDSHKTFRCDVEGCNSSFVNQQRLHQHKQTVHLGIRNYLCTECGASFKQPGNLSTHMLTHSEFKRLECEVCGWRFHTLGQKKEHMKKHTNERSHKCNFCDKAFNARSTLRRHIFTHTGEKRARCPFCPKAYPDPRTLRHHISRHHPETAGGASNSNQSVSQMGGVQNTNSDYSDSDSE